MDIRDYLKEELEKEQALFDAYEKMLSNLPEGRLETVTSKGKTYYMTSESGERKYIGKAEEKTVRQLKLRRFLEESMRDIAANVKRITGLLEKFRPVNPEAVIGRLPKSYRADFFPDIPGFDFARSDDWDITDYPKSRSHPEQLKHTTLKGDKVRSKSELNIANMLYTKGIPYHYEELVRLRDCTVAADFKIAVRSENRFVLLEHIGMLGNEDYEKVFVLKFIDYVKSGYVPWRDVFFTFDEGDGNLDTLFLSKLMDKHFL